MRRLPTCISTHGFPAHFGHEGHLPVRWDEIPTERGRCGPEVAVNGRDFIMTDVEQTSLGVCCWQHCSTANQVAYCPIFQARNLKNTNQ